MRLVFRQLGGVAGLTLVAEVDARQLSSEALAEARQLFTAPREESEPDRQGRGGLSSSRVPADVLVYEVTIIERRRRVTLQFDALSVPPEADALVEELREAATGEGPPSMSGPRRR